MDENIGKTFSRWTIIGDKIKKHNHTYYLCKCICGTEKYVGFDNLITWKTKSCGCLRVETTQKRAKVHGKTGTRLYRVWQGIKRRCYNVNEPKYSNYGGRGIIMCDEWKNDYTAFEKWALENGYDKDAEYGKCTIDRIDVDGNYEPNNCQWITSQEQNNNRTTTIKVTYNGKTQSIKKWSDEIGIPYSTIIQRYENGAKIEDLFKPVSEPLTITAYGEIHTVKEWSEITGLTTKAIYKRYWKHKPIEEIFYKGNLRDYYRLKGEKQCQKTL